MNEQMGSIEFDDKKSLENLKESKSFYLDQDLQKELRGLTIGSAEVLEENSKRILQNLQELRQSNGRYRIAYENNIDRAREYTSVIRPCHETSGKALLQILEDGKFLPHYEARRQYPDINARTTEADKGINSDLSIFCGLELFKGLGDKYSVVFNKEVLERPTTYLAFNDLAECLSTSASQYKSKSYLDQYRKRIIPGRDARKILSESLATFQQSYYTDFNERALMGNHEKMGVPESCGTGDSGRPEIQLLNPTVQDIEAVVIRDVSGRKINNDVDEKVLVERLQKLDIPVKYLSDIKEVKGEKSAWGSETFFKELEQNQS